jgi:predicted acyl esterase
VVTDGLDPHLGLVFASAPFATGIELAGSLGGVLDFTVNTRDVDVALGVYERNDKGQYLALAWWLQRASHAGDRRQRRLLQPNAPQRLVVRDTRLLGRRLAPGSQLVVTLGVVKEPGRQLDLGSGKEPSEETIEDAGDPLEIRWHGSSCLDFGIRE